MFRSLAYRVRTWLTIRKRRVALYRRVGDHDYFGFLAMVGMPIAILGAIIYFAFASQASLENVRLDAAKQREKDLHCLAENIYFEARGEAINGQFAIAEVTMNRLASRHFPKTICEVVHDTRWDAKRQRLTAHFSWTELKWKSAPSGAAWDRAMAVATAVYDDAYMPVVPTALFYHASYMTPYWASSKRQVAQVGNHIFYR